MACQCVVIELPITNDDTGATTWNATPPSVLSRKVPASYAVPVTNEPPQRSHVLSDIPTWNTLTDLPRWFGGVDSLRYSSSTKRVPTSGIRNRHNFYANLHQLQCACAILGTERA